MSRPQEREARANLRLKKALGNKTKDSLTTSTGGKVGQSWRKSAQAFRREAVRLFIIKKVKTARLFSNGGGRRGRKEDFPRKKCL